MQLENMQAVGRVVSPAEVDVSVSPQDYHPALRLSRCFGLRGHRGDTGSLTWRFLPKISLSPCL